MSPWMHIRVTMSAPPRRDSQSSQTGTTLQRPKLLRSNATEPSISASDTARASLTSSPHRAAELLNKVVYIPSAYGEHAAAPEKLCRRTTEPYMLSRRESQPPSTGATLMGDSYSGSYFSFPSFDVWEQPKEAEEVDER